MEAVACEPVCGRRKLVSDKFLVLLDGARRDPVHGMKGGFKVGVYDVVMGAALKEQFLREHGPEGPMMSCESRLGIHLSQKILRSET